MRILIFLLQKEFKQIIRNKLMLRMIILVPVIQLVVLVPAVTFEIKNIRMGIVDFDMSETSRDLIRRFQGSPFFQITHTTFSPEHADELLNNNSTDLIMTIPPSFEQKIKNNEQCKIQFIINAINGNFAMTAFTFCQGILGNFNQNLLKDYMTVSQGPTRGLIRTVNRYWFNEELDYKIYMAPGILVILVTAIGFLLCGLNLVREKEIGTSEQINVTPIKRYQFIAGKLIPFLIIALFDFSFGLFLAKIIYKLPMQGNLFVLFLFLFIYLISILSLGLFMSTFAETQQQYLFIAFFFQMIFVLMSGIFTPLESMPHWAQVINTINPVSHFMKVIRMVLLKGATFPDILRETIIVSILGAALLSSAILRYRKTA
ncbi:MAG: ABC transporter permease [Chitinispirillia bacterium]|jgi:ABC-2 type transport system permease protein